MKLFDSIKCSLSAIVILDIVIYSCCEPTGSVYFKPGSEYRYSLTGTTAIDDVKEFQVDAKIGIINLGQLANQQQHCELQVHYYFINTDIDGSRRQVNIQELNFTRWCSFHMNQHGEITKVLSSSDEDLYVLAVKKTILGALSSRLIVSQSQHRQNRKWGYKAQEMGHEGVHDSTYQAVPSGDVIAFTKEKHTPPVAGAFHKYKKDVSLGVKSGVPESTHIAEAFATPKSVPPGYKTIIPGAREELLQGDRDVGIPTMGGNSTMKLLLDSVVTNDDYLYRIASKPTNVTESSLKIEKIPEATIPLDMGKSWIIGNLTCAVDAKKQNRDNITLYCFNELQLILKRLHTDDLVNITRQYRRLSDEKPLMWQMFLNAVGAVQTNNSLELLLKETILNPKASSKLLMNAMVHFIRLDHCPSKVIITTFEDKVFQNPWQFNDTDVTNLVNERAELILGSLVSASSKCYSQWAHAMTRQLETVLGVHDPVNHREARSTMEQPEFKKYVNKKALHILALGNGQIGSSLQYFESFLNTSESHLHLRCSSVEAISKYGHQKAAEMLLKVMITDGDETVRRNAKHAYERHPHGGDLTDFVQTLQYPNMTTEKHKRMKKSIADVLGRIWKGFDFQLKTPSFNWRKQIGGAMLGASMGVIFQNSLDVFISPLSGSAKVDVHDVAWATIHIGLIGFDIDIFRAELCYKGSIEYKINILAEFGFGDIAKYAEKYDKVIKKVVGTIKTAIDEFKGLVNIWKDFDIGEVFDRFMKSIKDLPKKVLDLKKIGRKIMHILDKYVDLPPVIEMIKKLVEYVNTLLSDIKTDVMTLYRSIADTITITLPWAWKEIKESFNGIVDSFKSIVKNPKKAIQKIGRSIARITAAVGVLLESKNKIVEANIFDKDQRPYWFDIKIVFKNLQDQIKDITEAVGNIANILKVDEAENSEAIAFTGIDLTTMTKNTLREIWQDIQDELSAGPLVEIEQLLSPFLQTYDFFTTSVRNVKDAWTLIVNANAKTDLELIFGFKVNSNFPNKFLESRTCGDGFWKGPDKGRYNHPGISFEVTSDTVVSPGNGIIRQTGDNEVTIEILEMDETEIILENVKLHDGLEGTEIGGGSDIGTIVQSYWCIDKHIHLAMRRTGGHEYIDPTKYIEKREMPPPVWKEECDFYVLRWLGDTLSQGSITADPENQDESPDLPNAPSASDLDVGALVDKGIGAIIGRKKRFLDNWVDNLKDFADSLGLPKIDSLKDVFKLSINNITMDNLLKFLDKYKLMTLKQKIDSYIGKLQEFSKEKSCQRPSSMTDEELQHALKISGKSATGARKTLEKRYTESDAACYGIRNTLGASNWCQFDSSCLSVSCCVELKFFKLRYTLYGFITLDPCTQTLTFGIDSWSKSISLGVDNFAIERTETLVQDLNILDIAQLMVYYKIQKEDNVYKVSFGVTFCATYDESKCKDLYMIAKEAQFVNTSCRTTSSRDKRSLVHRQKRSTSELQGILGQTVGDFLQTLDFSGLDESDMEELIESITDAFGEWLIRKIEGVVANIFGDQFSSFDICLKGYDRSFGPYEVPIYVLEPPWIIPLGPIPCTFRFGINGYYGATFRADLCLLSMKAKAKILPVIGSIAWGSFGLELGPSSFRFTAIVKLTGYLLTTSFPTKVEVAFTKFPIDIQGRMDMVLVPLRIQLRLILRLQIRISLPWGKKITWRRTLINYLIWHYQSNTIRKNILNVGELEEDKTVPVFRRYPPRPSSEDGGEMESKRGKRSVSNGGIPSCTVYQFPDKDYTEPGFFLGIGVIDDKSEVEMTYCIGRFSGGCDVVSNEPLGGDSVVQNRYLYPGVTLYVTVTAKNTQGLPTTSVCQLPTYDVTLPGGRVTPDFLVTSHPTILRASIFIADDTPIIKKSIAVGYGQYIFGDQIIAWNNFDTQADDRAKPHVYDPAGLSLLDHFANPRQGRLSRQPFRQSHYDYPQGCAKDCLAHPGTKCMSFNYDYGPAGTCELLEMVEGHVKLHHSGSFFHFERLGIGHMASFNYNKLSLEHNSLQYFNLYLQNELHYEHTLTSEGILVDTTIPHPGFIANASMDVVSQEDCTSFTPLHLSQKCLEQTPLQNYRYVIDGPGSMAVFNGHTPLTDLSYTRANKMISANWDGFGDNETGILIYTWSIGTEPCAFNIHPHKDPHAHIAYESEWTHIGVAYPLDLPDGKFHVTVRALNDIEFGGPMAVTVCHSHPYIIDTTDPVIEGITQAIYNENLQAILLQVNASDDLSGIKKTEIAFGRTKRDTYIMIWTAIAEYKNITFATKLPDGIPVWVKIRVTNNVDLRCSDNSPRPIFVDNTPPIGGGIYIGTRDRTHMAYQSQSDVICANWHEFHDPDSGISAFMFGIGSGQGETDIKAYEELPHDAHQHCEHNLTLLYKHTYYVTITAENGATLVKNVTVSSAGVFIDSTPPVPGWVKDGLPGKPDTAYSSSSTTVTATWGNFKDDESGLSHSDVLYYRKSNDLQVKELIHSENKLNTNVTSYEKHHFHLKHKDTVSVAVNVANNAGLSTSVESDAYKVDLTDPVLVSLMDGYNVSNDIQYMSNFKLSATWKYTDQESGLAGYEFSAYSVTGGTKKKIFPDGKSHSGIRLSSATHTYVTPQNLPLSPGGMYFIRITATNNAKLTSIHDTNGAIFDPTPPEMKYVRAGVFAGEPEHMMHGFIHHNDRTSISGSWIGSDFESGISDYIVGLGTSPGSDDVSNFKSLGKDEDGHLTDLQLELTNTVTDRPIYYISVYTVNGAGVKSDVLSSSPIKIVEEDKEGMVWDGPEINYEGDDDFQIDHSTATVQFSGFQSALHGISYYEWAIGTRPRLDDIKPYSDQGLIVREDVNQLGIGSSGYGHLPMSLKQGTKYFSTIRAITGAGNILDSSSDGFLVDDTPPGLEVTKLGISDDISDGIIYQRSTDEIEAVWQAKDNESNVNATVVMAGTYPGNDDILSTRTIMSSSLSTGMLKPQQNGVPNILAVIVENEVGLITTVFSPAVVIDDTPPSHGKLYCPNIVSGNSIACTWERFKDEESGISKFLVGLGNTEGDTSIISLKEVPADENSIILTEDHGLSLKHNKKYFVTLKAVNHVNMGTTIFSLPIQVDSTPPVTGWIIELKDFSSWTPGSSPSLVTIFEPEMDVKCQRDLNRLAVAWESFTDEESVIVKYEIGVGSTPGGTQIRPFKTLSGDLLQYVFTELDLYDVNEVFVIVRGYNKVGLKSSAISNGVYISRHSAGLTPRKPLYVKDGLYSTDIDFQNNRDTIAATWDFSGDPCPVIEYEWGVKRFDGKEILPMTKIPKGQTFATADGLDLHDRESYFVVLKATNHLGYVTMLHSDGVTVKLEPLIPGIVRDGKIPGVDFRFQTSITSISGNWDGFGNERTDGSFDEPMYDQSQDIEIGDHQNIMYYEAALGTDRRYADTRDNVHHFVSVGLNKTWTFTNLELSSNKAIYYITVRAYSVSTAMVEVTSNGVRIINETGLISTGEIDIPRYISSTSSLSFEWNNFEFKSPVMHYYWGIKQGEVIKETVTCEDLLLDERNPKNSQQSHLDVQPLSDVGLDTYVKTDSIKVVHGTTYTLYVTAVDEAGICGLTNATFSVDDSPPLEGDIIIGPELNKGVLYAQSSEQLIVSWKGYRDDESGIKGFTISLYKGDACSASLKDNTPLVNDIKLPASSSSYTFLEITIQEKNVYFIILKTENKAGLSSETTSKPIVSDFVSPVPGKVTDGHSFEHDKKYQSSVNSVSGTFLYTPPGNTEPCPFRIFDLKMMESFWTKIIHRGMWLLPDNSIENIIFLDSQVTYIDENVISINLERDITSEQMLSGAVMARSDIFHGGTYEFDIRPSKELQAITSVAFWEGSQGLFVDHSTISKKRQAVNDGYVHGSPDPLKGDTFTSEYNSARKSGVGFGFQIIPGKNGTEVQLWSSDVERTRTVSNTFEHIDPYQWQNFQLKINDEEQDVSKENWVLKLEVNHNLMGELGGVTGVGSKSNVLIGVYRPDVQLPVVADRFQPPKTTTFIRIKRFPPPSDALCRHGMPFQAHGHAIMEIYAALGSEKNMNDIVNFHEVHKPCIPCVDKCDELICDKQCKYNEVQVIQVQMDNLKLNPFDKTSDSVNGTKMLKSYYVTVKGITGSGREAISSSNGFYIDETPPFINTISHTDPSWNAQEPIKFQGNNNTIAVYWETTEDYSEITEYKWAIGTSPGINNVQGFVSTGTNPLASNTELHLTDNTTYYVTVMAYNEAGLVTNMTSDGVTVLITPPDLESSEVSSPNTEPIQKTSRRKFLTTTAALNTVLTRQQDSVSCVWNILPNQNIESVYGSVGTSKNSMDIFSEIQVALNNSGILTINRAGAQINNDSIGNLSNFDNQQHSNPVSSFFMERGRTMLCNLRACNKGHVCSRMPSKNIVIIGHNDTVKTTDSQGYISVDDNSAGHHHVNIKTLSAQPQGTYLIYGSLSEKDLQQEYSTAASSSFTPFITNPATTFMKTDRNLFKRWQGFTNITFYLGSLPDMEISGPLTCSVDLNNSFDNINDIIPKLLTWCPDEKVWIEAADTCEGTDYRNEYDRKTNSISANICDIDMYCSHLESNFTSRKKRQATSGGFSRTKAFVVAGINATVVNHPPYVTSQNKYHIYEDPGTVEVLLTAVDPENDVFEFVLNNTYVSNGTVNLSKTGQISYKPCQDCEGTDEVHFIIVEQQNGHVPSLTTNGVVTFIITPVNDNPEVLVLQEGHVLESIHNIITLTVENNAPSQQPYSGLDILISALDVDGDSLKLYYEPPEHGNLKIIQQMQTTYSVVTDCSLPWNNLSVVWNKELSKFYSYQEFAMPLPCQLNRSLTNNNVNWMLSLVNYKVRQNYTGKDTVKVYAADKHGTPSYVLNIDIYILTNPCWHNATCYKPIEDENCTGTQRSQGFHDYYCYCSLGYTGTYCETDINECASNPCKDDYICKDEIGQYTCECADRTCGKTLETWIIIVIVFSLMLIIVVGSLCAWWFCCKKGHMTKVGCYSDPSVNVKYRIEDNSSRPGSRASLIQDLDMSLGGKIYKDGHWVQPSARAPVINENTAEKHPKARNEDALSTSSHTCQESRSDCDFESRPVTAKRRPTGISTSDQENCDNSDSSSIFDMSDDGDNHVPVRQRLACTPVPGMRKLKKGQADKISLHAFGTHDGNGAAPVKHNLASSPEPGKRYWIKGHSKKKPKQDLHEMQIKELKAVYGGRSYNKDE